MSYTKHNYKKGDELLASQLNEMDDQIELNEQTADILVTVSNTQPSQEKNRVWVKATPSEIEIPTMDDMDDLSRQLSDLEDTVSTTQIINSASGAIASFDDGADGQPIQKLVAQIEPVQDLHGYDSPWPAGGRVNKLPALVAGTYTATGLSIVVDNNGFAKITRTANGTGAVFIPLTTPFVVDSGMYFHQNSTGDELLYDVLSLADESESCYSTWYVGIASDQNIAIPTSAIGKTITSLRYYINTASRVGECTLRPSIDYNPATPTAWSPYSNICPISGHTGAEIEQTGVNVWDEEWENGGINDTTGEPNVSVNSQFRSKRYIPCKPNTEYFAYYNGAASGGLWVYFYDENRNYIGRATQKNATDYNVTNYVFTTIEGTAFMLFKCQPQTVDPAINDKTVSINYPATDTEYHPYTGTTIPITFPTTIYGGSDEVIGGNLVDNRFCFTATPDLTYSLASSTETDQTFYVRLFVSGLPEGVKDTCISNMFSQNIESGSGRMVQTPTEIYFVLSKSIADSIETLKAWLTNNNVVFSYQRATPVEYTLTANELTTLYGQNNVWTDVGDVSVDYPADTKLYIDNKIATAVANALNA